MNYLCLICAVPTVLAGSLKLDFQVNDGRQNNIIKKDNYFNMPLKATDNVGFYFTELQFGSTNDKIVVLVDTGSADLWVTGDDATCYQRSLNDDVSSGSSHTSGWSVADADVCKHFGSFDWEDSTSFNRNSTAFDITYADGTFASGFWGYDQVSIGNVSVDDVSFGVANESSDVMGTLGLGLPGVELLVLSGKKGYENLPQKLKNQGIIDRQIYSLYLNEAKARSGTVLFGAIDHEKYRNELVTVPLLTNVSLFRNQVMINMDSLAGMSTKKKGPVPTTQLLNDTIILLDSGTTITGFLKEVLTKLAESLGGGGTLNSNYYVDCRLVPKASLQMTVKNATVNMSMSDFVYKYYDQCYLSFTEMDSQGEYIIFGQDFLRHLYVVYDFDGLEVSLAQAYYTKKEDIEVVGADGKFNRTSSKHKGAASLNAVSIRLLVVSLIVSIGMIV
ncbi:Candidapepsin-9 [Candida viswanathii]|uniref:candidapepsin n=1 Tax=Candida viswanathii TaxID=5486 RepID=A0A367XZY3_9ASCO|nr:Candidapepsin-9 [Candida viswanathii]